MNVCFTAACSWGELADSVPSSHKHNDQIWRLHKQYMVSVWCPQWTRAGRLTCVWCKYNRLVHSRRPLPFGIHVSNIMATYNTSRYMNELLEKHASDPPSFTVRLFPEHWTLNGGSRFLYNNQVAVSPTSPWSIIRTSLICCIYPIVTTRWRSSTTDTQRLSRVIWHSQCGLLRRYVSLHHG